MITPISVACRLIGICGHAHSGKDLVGMHLHETQDNTYKLAFADPLKRAAAEMFGILPENFYDEDFKELQDQFWGVSPRQIAQFFGTEMVRQTVDRLIPGIEENFWISRMIHSLSGAGDSAVYDENDVVVITDVRFQNEYDWIISQGGIIIHLVRPGADGAVGIPGHASEAAIQFHAPEHTHTIINHSTLEELYAEVDTLINTLKFYPFSDPEMY